MTDPEIRERTENLIEDMDSLEKVYNFFDEIGYGSEVKDTSYKRDKNNFSFKDDEKEKIREIYSIMDFDGNLPVFLIETKSLSSGHVKYISKRLSRDFTGALIIFTKDYEDYTFVLPQYEAKEAGEHKLKLTKLNLNRKNIFYSDVQILSSLQYDTERSWRHIWREWKDAFSVEKVTESFFDDYQRQFFRIREKLLDQGVSIEESHELTLQFMNRMMFVYFVDKKGWMEGNNQESYINWLWKKYRAKGGLQDDSENFYEDWLQTLFHYAFNNRYAIFSGKERFPEEVNKSFRNAPYLNGGLFRKNELSELEVEIDDDVVGDLIKDFFEKYNFTIKEDMPLDEEVAVDPQMIGYVYETLSNKAEKLEDVDKDSRKEFGIFYTPRDEVYFMVRRSLVEHLDKNTGTEKEDLYKLVFAETAEQKRKIRKKLSEEELEEIKLKLHGMKAVDPACGSGAFLVGIINIISDIYEIAERKTGGSLNKFEIKKRIIQESIYGVDVKEWAIHASELRLFLQLLIETDVSKERIQQKALLPNLRANLRVGDSLVQDIDGIFFDLRKNNLEGLTRAHLEEIQNQKAAFFRDRDESDYNSITDLEEEEVRFFQRAIDDKIKELQEKIEGKSSKQQKLNGETKEPSGQEKRKLTRKKKQAKKQIEKLEEIKKTLHQNKEKMPLLWEVAFAEVFDQKSGFDIVIGNPPYVRQEGIAPPNMPSEDVTRQDKTEYKNKLIESVQNRMPQIQKISKRSDLYIYFYFHGLSLLNKDGTFCFITSNSWLDVGYGAELQEFLCKHVPIEGIYNNQNNRSFEHAEVNTVISVFGAPNFETKTFANGMTIDTDVWPETDHNAHFVNFKRKYREAVNAENMIALENEQNYDKEIQLDHSSFQLFNTQDFRSVQIAQGNLLEDGWDYPEDFNGDAFTKGDYKNHGNKWGGKFLRAPDIFFDILAENAGKLNEIGSIANKVQRGISTGANDFFFVEDVTNKIESLKEIENSNRVDSIGEIKKKGLAVIKPSRYAQIDSAKLFLVDSDDLTPAIQNTDEAETLEINGVSTAIFAPENTDLTKSSQDYVCWGESESFNNGYTCKRRDPWWDLKGHSTKEATKIGFNYNIHDTGHFYFSEKPRFYSDNFHTVDYEDNSIQVLGESTLGVLMINIFCRTPFGGGKAKLQTYELEEIPLPLPKYLDGEKVENVWQKKANSEIKLLFEEIGLERNKPIREQEPEPLPDRKELDDIVFDALGLSEEERKEVYWAVAELVKARLDKAESA